MIDWGIDPARLRRAARAARRAGVFALVACAAGAFTDRSHFFQGYLTAYLFWLGLALGSLALALLHRITGGRWGVAIQDPLAAAIGTLPLLAALYTPLLLGMRDLYPWARPEAAQDLALVHKSGYLNGPHFVLRAFVYFAVWLATGRAMGRAMRPSPRPDAPTPSDVPVATPVADSMTRRSPLGLILYSLTMTFAAIDWMMSLEPHWSSTIYGVTVIVAQILGAMALCIGTLRVLQRMACNADLIDPLSVSDLGNLLLGFVMLWAYMTFMQYLIIWSANLPEEVTWYVHRAHGGWAAIGVAIILLSFALPFALLLARRIKRRLCALSNVAALIMLMRIVELHWLVVPAFAGASVMGSWQEMAALVGLGGIWLAVFLDGLARRLAHVPPETRHGVDPSGGFAHA